MKLSFVVTTQSDAAVIDRVLAAVAACARPGDQVVLVDDDSPDGTPEIIARMARSGGFGAGVDAVPILLGTRSAIGRAGPANIGLAHATGDAVFVMQGSDLLLAGSFQAARRAFDESGADVWLGACLDHDNPSALADPAEGGSRPGHVALPDALALAPEAWRLFLCRELIERGGLRFPEDAALDPEHPFHWQACLKARRIGLSRRVICRPQGAEGGPLGAEALALSGRFRELQRMLPARAPALRVEAACWLIGRIAQHAPRLEPAQAGPYAAAASAALNLIRDRDWNGPVAERMGGQPAWHHAARLRAGDPWSVAEAWLAERGRQETAALAQLIGRLDARLDRLEARLSATHEMAVAQRALAEFGTMRQLRSAARSKPQ